MLEIISNLFLILHVAWIFLITTGAILSVLGTLSRKDIWAIIVNSLNLITVGFWFIDWKFQIQERFEGIDLSNELLINYLGQIGIELSLVQLSWIIIGIICLTMIGQLAWATFTRLTKKREFLSISKVNATLISITVVLIGLIIITIPKPINLSEDRISGEIISADDSKLTWKSLDGTEKNLNLDSRVLAIRRFTNSGDLQITMDPLSIIPGETFSGIILSSEARLDMLPGEAPSQVIDAEGEE